MAYKKLKTITFPDLEDTYTVPQVPDGMDGDIASLDGSGNIKDAGFSLSVVNGALNITYEEEI